MNGGDSKKPVPLLHIIQSKALIIF